MEVSASSERNIPRDLDTLKSLSAVLGGGKGVVQVKERAYTADTEDSCPSLTDSPTPCEKRPTQLDLARDDTATTEETCPFSPGSQTSSEKIGPPRLDLILISSEDENDDCHIWYADTPSTTGGVSNFGDNFKFNDDAFFYSPTLSQGADENKLQGEREHSKKSKTWLSTPSSTGDVRKNGRYSDANYFWLGNGEDEKKFPAGEQEHSKKINKRLKKVLSFLKCKDSQSA